jgi:hypothetical protein
MSCVALIRSPFAFPLQRFFKTLFSSPSPPLTQPASALFQAAAKVHDPFLRVVNITSNCTQSATYFSFLQVCNTETATERSGNTKKN